MKIEAFKLERYFARYEFETRFLLSSSDCEALKMEYVLSMAEPETLVLWNHLTLGYTESQGLPALRDEISKLYKTIKPEEILVSAPEEGIFIAINSILEKGDHLVCTFPGYQSLYQIAENLGSQVTHWLPEEEDGWKFDPEDIEKKIRPNTKLLIINFPHNPTGYLPSLSDFNEIISVARKHKLYLLSDEMYRGLEYIPTRRLPAACDLYEKAISLSGMSKAFGLAGLRIGWLATHSQAILKGMAGFKDYTTICSSAPSEILAVLALKAKDRILAEQTVRIKRNVLLLEEFFAGQTNKFEWTPPRAGTVAFPRIKMKITATEFCKRSIQEAGIMLLPSTVYGYGNHHLRVGFGRENLPLVLDKFKEFLDRI